MAGRQRYRVKAGDVFVIRVAPDRNYVGQVVAFRRKLIPYVVIFDRVFDDVEVHERGLEAVEAERLFSHATLTQNLEDGRWEVIGNVEPCPEKYVPAYRTGSEGHERIHSFSDRLKRPALPGEGSTISASTTVTPSVIEATLRAHEGMEEPLLSHDNVMRRWPLSVDVFGEI